MLKPKQDYNLKCDLWYFSSPCGILTSFTIIKSHLISFGLSLNISAPLTSPHTSLSRDLIFELSSEGLHGHKKTFFSSQSTANTCKYIDFPTSILIVVEKILCGDEVCLIFQFLLIELSSTFVLLLEEKSNYTWKTRNFERQDKAFLNYHLTIQVSSIPAAILPWGKRWFGFGHHRMWN